MKKLALALIGASMFVGISAASAADPVRNYVFPANYGSTIVDYSKIKGATPEAIAVNQSIRVAIAGTLGPVPCAEINRYTGVCTQLQTTDGGDGGGK